MKEKFDEGVQKIAEWVYNEKECIFGVKKLITALLPFYSL